MPHYELALSRRRGDGYLLAYFAAGAFALWPQESASRSSIGVRSAQQVSCKPSCCRASRLRLTPRRSRQPKHPTVSVGAIFAVFLIV